MSARVEQRLREILRERREARVGTPSDTVGEPHRLSQACGESPDARLRGIADTLGGDVVERDGGVAIVVERFYPADHQHGLLRLGDVTGCAMAAAPELSMLGGVPEPLDRAHLLHQADTARKRDAQDWVDGEGPPRSAHTRGWTLL